MTAVRDLGDGQGDAVAPVVDEIPHGTTKAYRYLGCRCDVCVQAFRERAAAWRAKNRDKISAQNARSYAKNRERDREKRRAAGRDYYQRRKANDLESLREAQKRSRSSAKTKRAQLLYQHRRRRVAPTPEAVEFIDIILRDPCSYCGEALVVELDHIVPVAKGGSGEFDNFTPACRSCNAKKRDKPLLKFLAEAS